MDGLSDIINQPNAIAVIALIALGVLWREDRRVYKERITDLAVQRDIATEGWKAQTDANTALVSENATLSRTNEANSKALAALSREAATRARSEGVRVRADGARRRLSDRTGDQ